jgi:hypothetical protein
VLGRIQLVPLDKHLSGQTPDKFPKSDMADRATVRDFIFVSFILFDRHLSKEFDTFGLSKKVSKKIKDNKRQFVWGEKIKDVSFTVRLLFLKIPGHRSSRSG